MRNARKNGDYYPHNVSATVHRKSPIAANVHRFGTNWILGDVLNLNCA